MLAPATVDSQVLDGRPCLRLAGHWTLAALPRNLSALQAELLRHAIAGVRWDLSGIERLDSAGALLIWRAWRRQWPADAAIPERHRRVLARAESLPEDTASAAATVRLNPWHWSTVIALGIGRQVRDGIALLGQLLLDCAWLSANPRSIPWREFSATLYKSGARALPVTALVGFLIGVVVSYLSSLQLKLFGAETFIVNILGMSIVRELGPVLVAVLVAGRSGSAMTAQIGVMRVTEEMDALATMGISRSLRLVLPKVAALTVAMPLLVVWCSAAGIVGGLVAANFQLDLSWGFFIEALPRAVPLANLWIALAKGAVFGLLIGLLACHFGLRVKPNTESLSAMTTRSVVTSITVVILADAVFAILTRNVGLPL